MASPKSSTKTSARSAVAKPAALKKPEVAVKVKPAVTTKPPVKAASKVKVKVAKGETAPTKAVAKTPARSAAKKPAMSAARSPHAISSEQRRCYVEVAAYHIAERRGFAPGDPLDDWVRAEAEIDRLLAAGLLGS